MQLQRCKLILIAGSLTFLASCGLLSWPFLLPYVPQTQVSIIPASEDVDDTLAESSVLLFQWVNTQYVKTEFDYTIDDQEARHVEIPPRSVINLRLTGDCPQSVTFQNVEFGDEYFAGIIPFVQDNVASEGDLAGEDGDFVPATFFCFSSWQIAVKESNITVAALDRQANSEDEGEQTISDLLSTDTNTSTTTPTTTPPPRTIPTSDDEPVPDGGALSGPRSGSTGGTGRMGSVGDPIRAPGGS